MKEYIVIGGLVESKSDGDVHFIPPNDLCRLYNVDPNKCYLFRNQKEYEQYRTTTPDLPLLRPRFNGNYQDLPTF